jgi:adenine-specific DNA methylase
VDFVVTDPPYFDNVMYSELADFFYVWLRLVLKDRYPWFVPEHSRREEELVQNEKEGKGLEYFSDTLASIWKEARRVLKDDGVLAITFHHNSPTAWAAMAESLMESGFTVTAAPFVRSEGKSGFHSSKGNIRYDAILVCRKGSPVLPSAGEWQTDMTSVIERAKSWLERTVGLNLPVNPGDVLTALMGEALVTLLSPRIRSGEPVDLLTVLSKLSEMVSGIEQEIEGRAPRQLAMFAEQEAGYDLDDREELEASEK